MKAIFCRMFKYMIFSNNSMFRSLLSGLKVSEHKTEQIFYPVSTQSKVTTITLKIIDGSCNREKCGAYRVIQTTF